MTDFGLTATLEADEVPYLTLEDMVDLVITSRENAQGYMETFFTIKTKGQGIVRFRLNRTQVDILDQIKRLWAQGKPVRLIILKARQEGVSTFIQALFFMLTVTEPNRSAWILTHDRESSSNLFGMSELYLDSLPPEISPMVRYRDKKRIRFENPDNDQRRAAPGLRSLIYVDHAKNTRAGRSTTIHFLHISERALWGADGQETMTSVMQSVPNTPDSIVVQETTAFGVDDPAGFYADWTENFNNPKATWLCLFYPWFIHAEYTMEIPPDELDEHGHLILQPDPDGEIREPDLLMGFHSIVGSETGFYTLTEEQVYWRRWAMANNCRRDPFVFMQEYPSTPDEAFMTSGRPWFSRAGLDFIHKSVLPPVYTGFFRTPAPQGWQNNPERGVWREDKHHLTEYRRGIVAPEWTTDDTGNWWVWKMPEPGHEYNISVDTAEGGEDGDRAAVQVTDRKTLEQVAEFNGYLDTDLLAHQVAMAATFYNMAYVIPEVNNTGYGFMQVFKDIYPRIYFRRNPEAPLNAPTQWVLGFRTDSTTRPILVTRGQNYVREGVGVIRSSRLLKEMRTFVKDKRGTPRASGRNHDDLVLAWLLMLELHESRPVRLEKPSKEPTLADDKFFQQHRAKMLSKGYGGRAKFF